MLNFDACRFRPKPQDRRWRSLSDKWRPLHRLVRPLQDEMNFSCRVARILNSDNNISSTYNNVPSISFTVRRLRRRQPHAVLTQPEIRLAGLIHNSQQRLVFRGQALNPVFEKLEKNRIEEFEFPCVFMASR
jgi:hypothetical protein